jgi:hypothetical protein
MNSATRSRTAPRQDAERRELADLLRRSEEISGDAAEAARISPPSEQGDDGDRREDGRKTSRRDPHGPADRERDDHRPRGGDPRLDVPGAHHAAALRLRGRDVRHRRDQPDGPHPTGRAGEHEGPRRPRPQPGEERRSSHDRHDQRARAERARASVLRDGEDLVAIECPAERIARVGEAVLVERPCEEERCADGAKGCRELAEREEYLRPS